MSVPQLAVIEIARVVAQIFHVSQMDILSHRRDESSVRARDATVLMAVNFCKHSLSHTGRCLGQRDHTTILAALRRAEALREIDQAYAELLLQAEFAIQVAEVAFTRLNAHLPHFDARAIAQRALFTPRGCVSLSVAEIEALALHVSQTRPEDDDLRRAVEGYVRVTIALRQASQRGQQAQTAVDHFEAERLRCFAEMLRLVGPTSPDPSPTPEVSHG